MYYSLLKSKESVFSPYNLHSMYHRAVHIIGAEKYLWFDLLYNLITATAVTEFLICRLKHSPFVLRLVTVLPGLQLKGACNRISVIRYGPVSVGHASWPAIILNEWPCGTNHWCEGQGKITRKESMKW
jgi:hypothetical protein